MKKRSRKKNHYLVHIALVGGGVVLGALLLRYVPSMFVGTQVAPFLPQGATLLQGKVASAPLSAGAHTLMFRSKDSRGQVLQVQTSFNLADASTTPAPTAKPTGAPTQACTDSDGGNNPKVAGWVRVGTSALKTQGDICPTGKGLREMTCSATGSLTTVSHDCTCQQVTISGGVQSARCL